MNTTRRSILAAAAAAPLLPGAAALAQARWQMATPYPEGNFHTRNVIAFLEELRTATSGRINVQLHPNASLLPMAQIKRGTQTGQVQMGEILLSAYGNEDVIFEVDSIPQLVPTYEASRRLNEVSRPFIQQRFERQGLELLYIVPWPSSGFYTNVPVESLEVLRGTRFRTFNVMTNRFATLIGANPVLIQAAEVPQAFATGVVNAMVTSAATGVDSSAWDFARYFTHVGFTYTRNAVFANRRAIAALSAADQAALRAAARTAEERGWRMSEEARTATTRTLGERGMITSEGNPAVMEAMARVSEQMVEEWLTRAGDDGRRIIEAYRAARG